MRRQMQGMARPYKHHLATWCYNNTMNAAASRQDNADPPFERRPTRKGLRKTFQTNYPEQGSEHLLSPLLPSLVMAPSTTLARLDVKGRTFQTFLPPTCTTFKILSSLPNSIYLIRFPCQITSTGSPRIRTVLFSLEHTVSWLLPYSGSERKTKTRRDRVVHPDHDDECDRDKTVTEDWLRNTVGELGPCCQLEYQYAELLKDTQFQKELIRGETRS